MASIGRRPSVRSLQPGYSEKDIELGNIPDSTIKFSKTGSTATSTGGYQDWEANAPHDPNHLSPPGETLVPRRRQKDTFTLLCGKTYVSVCHLTSLYAVIAILFTLLTIFTVFTLGHMVIDVNPTIVIDGMVSKETSANVNSLKTIITAIVSTNTTYTSRSDGPGPTLTSSSSQSMALQHQTPPWSTSPLPSLVVVTMTPQSTFTSYTTVTTTIPPASTPPSPSSEKTKSSQRR